MLLSRIDKWISSSRRHLNSLLWALKRTSSTQTRRCAIGRLQVRTCQDFLMWDASTSTRTRTHLYSCNIASFYHPGLVKPLVSTQVYDMCADDSLSFVVSDGSMWSDRQVASLEKPNIYRNPYLSPIMASLVLSKSLFCIEISFRIVKLTWPNFWHLAFWVGHGNHQSHVASMANVRHYLCWPNWTGLAQCSMAPVPATNCWLSLPMLPGVHPSPCRAKQRRQVPSDKARWVRREML